MKVNNPFLEKMAVNKTQYPKESLTEIVLVGRSNVGKSSFINSVLYRKKLAYTSSSPGKTRTINFYNIDNLFRFVDLPGYGYAKISMKEREKWKKIIDSYLRERKEIAEIFQIVDIRHEAGQLDKMMYDYIRSCGYAGLVIANKADKIPKSKIEQERRKIVKSLGAEDERVIAYSSENKYNIDLVWKVIDKINNAGI